jgi:hypothetical protein
MIIKIRRVKVMIEYKVKVYDDGDKYWYLNNKLHREDGPAVEYASGEKNWCLNGKRHREDGPAVECASYKLWYLNGTNYTEQEFNEKMNPTVKELSVSEISKLLGYEVKVVK